MAIPVEDVPGTEVYIVEEYSGLLITRHTLTDSLRFTSQAAHDSYSASRPTEDLNVLLSNRDTLSEPPTIRNNAIAIKTTSGPPMPLSANPAILLVGMEYNPETSSNAVSGWKDMAEGAVESVPGVNVFTVAEDAETNSVRTVEVLDSWESLNVLVKTDAAKRNIEHNGKDRTGVKSAIKLRAVAGFVGR